MRMNGVASSSQTPQTEEIDLERTSDCETAPPPPSSDDDDAVTTELDADNSTRRCLLHLLIYM